MNTAKEKNSNHSENPLSLHKVKMSIMSIKKHSNARQIQDVIGLKEAEEILRQSSFYKNDRNSIERDKTSSQGVQ